MITPLNGYVLAEALKAKEQTDSGIILPESVKEQTFQCKIVAVGKEKINELGTKYACPVKVGDTAIYRRYGTEDIKHKGKEYLLIDFDNLQAVIDDQNFNVSG